MLQEILNNDVIADYLFKRTSFTKTQLDTLLISLKKDDEADLNMKVSLRDSGRVSKGSFIRTLRQAQRNLEKSLYTIIISEYLFVLDENNSDNLIRTSMILREFKEQKINADKIQEVLDEISSVISKVCGKTYE
jgi:hypothetical protein